MNFNSFWYLLFLPCAAILYWSVPQRAKNWLLLILSYGFYMCWQPRFALLLFYVTLLSYGAGLLLMLRPLKKKLWLVLSLVLGLVPLFFYKYYVFFSGIIESLLAKGGLLLSLPTLKLLLPVGISFFTFQAIGYVLDVARGTLAAERHFPTYALFISFFPQISAGPIGRASQLLPQFRAVKHFCWDSIPDGLMLLFWGLFKKVLIADQLAVLVNTAYDAPWSCSGWQLILATVCFSVQIYCDFSGYSDIAIGSARFFGITLMRNFDSPYLSTSVKEFWRRWHISLSSWFRDYLYFPLGGSRKGKVRALINLMIVFTVSGLWHGAAMTFVLWGALNGLFQVLSVLTAKMRSFIRHALHVREDGHLIYVVRIICTFALISLAWVFFRANTLDSGLFIVKRMMLALLGKPQAVFDLSALGLGRARLLLLAVCMPLLIFVGAKREKIRARILGNIPLRTLVWFLLVASVLLCGSYGNGYNPQDFVYFKF